MSKILIVDDDVELCDLLEEYLAREGFEVEAVHQGDKGLERALSGEHTLVELDIMLPGMTGMDVLRRLRAESRTTGAGHLEKVPSGVFRQYRGPSDGRGR